MRSRRNHKLSIVGLGAYCLANVAVLAKGLRYVRAAQKDERNNFPYTAAMEWRLAAEFFGANTLAADYCWRHWEAIMRLPDRLREAVSDRGTLTASIQSKPAGRREEQTPLDRVSLAAAA